MVAKATRYAPREYRIWKLMRGRCNNPANQDYAYYGGRGIKVCERWSNFHAFLADMGSAPTSLHTIDRFPNQDGDYEPGNVRWATRKEQARNTCLVKKLTHDGLTLCLAEWAERMNMDPNVLTCRFRRGWSIEKALTTPARKWAAAS